MKAVIFDMDGLMFDTERLCVAAFDYAGEKCGMGKVGYMTLKTLGMNDVKSREIWEQEFSEGYNEQELHKYVREYYQRFYEQNRVPVKKGLYSLLEYLKENNYRLAVASSSAKESVERNLKDTQVYDYFDAVICGDMVEKSKPEPDIYLRACQELGQEPENCIALEDSRNGLLSAYRAGCKTIMVPDLWQPDAEIEKILFGRFQNLEEVKEFLETGLCD